MNDLSRSLAAQRIQDRFGYISVGVKDHHPGAQLIELEGWNLFGQILGPSSPEEFTEQARFVNSGKQPDADCIYFRARFE